MNTKRFSTMNYDAIADHIAHTETNGHKAVVDLLEEYKLFLQDPGCRTALLKKVGLLPLDQQKEIIRQYFPKMVVEGRSRHRGNLLLTTLDYIAMPVSWAFRTGFKAGFHLGYLAYGRWHNSKKAYRPHIKFGYFVGTIAALAAVAAMGAAAYFAAPFVAVGLALTGTTIGATIAQSLVSCAVAALAGFSIFNVIARVIANYCSPNKVPTASTILKKEKDSDSDESPKEEKHGDSLARQPTLSMLEDNAPLFENWFSDDSSQQVNGIHTPGSVSSTRSILRDVDLSNPTSPVAVSADNSPIIMRRSEPTSSSSREDKPLLARTPPAKRPILRPKFVTFTPKPTRRKDVAESKRSNGRTFH